MSEVLATRLRWVDRLRVVVVAGVVVVHVATAYLVDIDWHYEERTTSPIVGSVVAIPLGLGALYGLAPLFWVAGWLSRVSVSRHGRARFARSRLVRLGVPAAVFWALIDPVSDWLGGVAVGERRTLGEYLLDPFGERDLGLTWFIVALLAFSLLYAVRPPRERQAGALLVVAVVLAVAVVDFVVWLRWSYAAPTVWNLNWPHWPQAAGVFFLGAVTDPAHLPRRLVRWCGLAAAAGMVAVAALWGALMTTGTLEELAGGWHWSTAGFAVLDGTVAVGLSVWCVDWFRRRWNAPLGPIAARAARGSYATYLVHPPVLVLLSIAARSLPWPPEAKFVLVTAVGVPVSFAVGYVVARAPGVNRVV
jgi:hypothetical protein